MTSVPGFSAADHAFMARALQLAERGLNSTSPNPRVGCVIARNGRVVGEGWHERAGEPHAEVHALAAAAAGDPEAARGADVYVTLEPCAHYGRTPPCADALVAAGVARVVAAMQDPDPRVAGRGLERLAAAGIRTECGLLADTARELNIGFVSRLTCGRPWLRAKLAASLDGRTALADGASQWITGAAARADGQHWRARACAILSASGTVLHDDPQLSVRLGDAGQASQRQPLKVIVDSRLRTPPGARLLAQGQTLIVGAGGDPARAAALSARGAEVLDLPGSDGRVNLAALLAELARRGVNEIHVEAGRVLIGSLLAAGLVDELLLYFAPCLLGDSAQGMFALPPLASLAQRQALKIHDWRIIGDDLRVIARCA
ncbi:bifunctional diaminohydroxyphosphoribosylaminopyrimidine deaminase/5-amino-6-(5-phosphoribosylamino)uracil reductase RibD [Rhodocyclus tenuis]|uniref:bifunctional diaminohydroxyphosphoribosylaminopyrimidine deaminase/5-amino-6-(5-phosphoribosylamino)uracil reductase RibD n=1 Tax=Rhodocyclus tenuis TaxID=1066 RepID=UPI001902E1A4|nr:bifunctional diaminohydroxyphosphoribosylaminopyrimidine deaminase/5-amino-6-(5-phosphoribosylamino)uracil reductase RibD [Rhodocyclus tenuis]MBK1681220.1 riboflavin biosynthesis protein RibD [Rhodocyclus tenuis]